MEVDKTEGIICPWCPEQIHILKCGHNPFKLGAKLNHSINWIKGQGGLFPGTIHPIAKLSVPGILELLTADD